MENEKEQFPAFATIQMNCKPTVVQLKSLDNSIELIGDLTDSPIPFDVPILIKHVSDSSD